MRVLFLPTKVSPVASMEVLMTMEASMVLVLLTSVEAVLGATL